jgi:hypothetical protein
MRTSLQSWKQAIQVDQMHFETTLLQSFFNFEITEIAHFAEYYCSPYFVVVQLFLR